MQAGTRPLEGKSPQEKREIMKDRTKRLALGVIELSHNVPPSPAIKIIRDQLLRSATGVAANDRAACHARSRKEFCGKDWYSHRGM
jgi:four helix bundle protein